MATFTWKSGTNADWSVAGNWTTTSPGAVPPPGAFSSATDEAALGAAKTAYTVTVGQSETFDIAALDIAGTSATITTGLGISGALLTNTVLYTADGADGDGDEGAGPGTDADADDGKDAKINVLANGFLDIRTNITAANSETLTITGTGAGGHLEFGSAITSGIGINDSNVTFSFSNAASGVNAGVIEFNGPTFTLGSKTNQIITNVAQGNSFVFDGAKFKGDTFTYAGTTLTVTGSSGTPVLTMNNLSGPNLSSSSFVGVGNTIMVVCYAVGTRIRTPAGERLIESLMPGELVLTLSGTTLSAQPVKWVGHRSINLAEHPRPETVAPIRILRDAFGAAMPRRDLLVSPDHAIFVEGRLICARQLVNGTTIRQETDWRVIDYYHVELDRHAILMADGLPAESYIDTGNKGFFGNSGEPRVLHPDLTDESDYPTREAASCVPFVWNEADVRPVWQRLADRAAMLGHPVPRHGISTEADLHLLASGRKIKPIDANTSRAIFILPRGTHEVHLVSRAQSPTEARPWLEDRRRLGVRVARIVLRGDLEVQEVPVDHPCLTEGWWAVERDGVVISRWTSGKAVLPLPAMQEDAMLEIHLAGAMTYAVEADKPAAPARPLAA
jgi:hypothetical protein